MSLPSWRLPLVALLLGIAGCASLPLSPRGDEPSGKIVYACALLRDAHFNQVCVMNPDGSGQRRLTLEDGADHFYPSLAPDGNSLVFSSNREGGYRIYEMNLEGEVRPISDLEDAYAPEISPDGEWIVFARFDGRRQVIWIVRRDGGSPRPLTSEADGNSWDPTWSPDGARILFASDRSGGIQLFAMNPDGTGATALIELPGLRGRSAWSPDGKTLATYAGTGIEREIFLLAADGGSAQQVTGGGINLHPDFSPDGQWIVFTSHRDDPRLDHGCELYIMRTDGTDLRRLTENDHCDWHARWGK